MATFFCLEFVTKFQTESIQRIQEAHLLQREGLHDAVTVNISPTASQVKSHLKKLAVDE